MGKSSLEKVYFAEDLFKQGKSYRFIQSQLVEKFGSGMSNTTLKNLQKRTTKMAQFQIRISELEHELALFKRLYFEIKDQLLKRMQKKNSNQNIDVSININIRKCTNCNANLSNLAIFCSQCGERIGKEFK